MLCDDEIQICARDTRGEVTRGEVGNWDMAGGNFTTEAPWSKLHFESSDEDIANCQPTVCKNTLKIRVLTLDM